MRRRVLTVSFGTQQELLERLFLLARAFATNPKLLNHIALPAPVAEEGS